MDAKEMLSSGRGGNQPPTATGAKGTIKFWVAEGVLSKYEFKVQGKMTFGGNEVEIKNVGSTKVEVPEDAKKKLE